MLDVTDKIAERKADTVMEKMISKNGNVGYRYDEGERPDIDAFIYRLSQFGPSKQYWYETIFEVRDITDNFDYNEFDKERVERIGYPLDWLRRCGLTPRTFLILPDDNVKELCENIKAGEKQITGSDCPGCLEKRAERQ